jgi:hypothetical protein
MIIGHDNESTQNNSQFWWIHYCINMKEYKDLLDINSPINEIYWHEESYESQALST